MTFSVVYKTHPSLKDWTLISPHPLSPLRTLSFSRASAFIYRSINSSRPLIKFRDDSRQILQRESLVPSRYRWPHQARVSQAIRGVQSHSPSRCRVSRLQDGTYRPELYSPLLTPVPARSPLVSGSVSLHRRIQVPDYASPFTPSVPRCPLSPLLFIIDAAS